MLGAMILMIVGGIGLTQAVSDPAQVTLRWLRLGGMIAVALLTAVATLVAQTSTQGTVELWVWLTASLLALPFVVELLTIQLAWRHVQRVAAAIGFLAISFTLTAVLRSPARLALFGLARDGPVGGAGAWAAGGLALTLAVSCGVLGGHLMTMLLGHAYLTAGSEMSQAPFARLVRMMAILLAMRTVLSLGFGLAPYWSSGALSGTGIEPWSLMMVTARFAVGLLVPGVFTYMTYDCVMRRANQSATGILYVTLVLVIIGEGTAWTLLERTGLMF